MEYMERLAKIMFQFTRPRGARRHAGRGDVEDRRFNSRAREGRDDGFAAPTVRHDEFQFTRPRGARRQGAPSRRRPSSCFNSRAREGRDRHERGRHHPRQVVSIHAPARGATDWDEATAPCYITFQFTRPRGARLSLFTLTDSETYVSIHAPARGATRA